MYPRALPAWTWKSKMASRNGWLFPLMVFAAGSVTAFGAIGIAAITGYLPLARGVNPLGDYPAGPGNMEQTATAQDLGHPMAVVAVQERNAAVVKAVEFPPEKPPVAPRRTVN
jgi:hypothetical protein